MKKSISISGSEIKNLVTKFYYKGNSLCFQILIDLQKMGRVVYKEYTDYSEYKKDYGNLKNIKSANLNLRLTKIALPGSITHPL